MTRLNVNPTRMELSKLKKQLDMSVRGHKLLKDKQDELMRQFVLLVKENYKMRDKVEAILKNIVQKSILAKAEFPVQVIENTYFRNDQRIKVDIKEKNLMGLAVPKMDFTVNSFETSGFFASNNSVNASATEMEELLPQLLKLAESEKICTLLAAEIEKVRRRVNALEYMTIPQLQETVRFIKMRLEDNERDSITRLIKMNDMMA